ncbi:cysteine protease ATG4 [Marchantia polymorpha subsp. ruderalis]|uniref:Cysteine protease n=2 Tax=Marchantia polymorpha TaxID=3197 RepID=A0AAF6AQ54_MARPO|nr:hypothetical protein MARPO_0153s0038 [Marchantia polymorpha]BBM98574.1 hypothetical protein Mp_1g14510 [Marchantia polymorpha subsp. ruderalis]|eukprot:PTQ28875.1 hypothetical protein MARPO_0153s0038 [Marchantia polymorpha]
MTTNSEQEEQATKLASNFWSKKVSEVSRSLHLKAGESLILGLMEKPRNQVRRLHDKIWGAKWTSGTASNSTIWVLGASYEFQPETRDEPVAEFLLDFSSRVWLTYRRGFEALGQSKFTSDVGWGCMLRSGQMLLAQALVCHHLGRGWRLDPDQPLERKYLEILQSFGDCRGALYPFSIHNLLERGSPYGLVAGSWLGPYALCRTIEALALADIEASKNEKQKRALPMAVCVVSGDAEGERGGAPVLFIEDVTDKCAEWEDGPGKWAPLLVLVPLVLGLEKVNPRYLPSLRATFSFPQSLGIAGGKPGASHYLVGIQDDQALYLDPHETQQAVSISPDDVEADTHSYHCREVRRMPLDAIDPSLALGFYCKSREDFDDLCTRASELATQSQGAPMFTVAQGRSRKHSTDGFNLDKLSIDVQESSTKDHVNADTASSPEDDWQIL